MGLFLQTFAPVFTILLTFMLGAFCVLRKHPAAGGLIFGMSFLLSFITLVAGISPFVPPSSILAFWKGHILFSYFGLILSVIFTFWASKATPGRPGDIPKWIDYWILLVLPIGSSLVYWHTQELRQIKVADLEVLRVVRKSPASEFTFVSRLLISVLIYYTVSMIRKARALARTREDFLALMNHEIRNPLNAIIGCAKAMRTARGETLEVLQTSLTQTADYLLLLINNALDYSQVVAGKFVLAETPFDPREVISQVASLFSGLAANKKLDWTQELRGEIPNQVLGDPGRLQQILINLVGNAMKYTQSGWVKLIVRATVGERGIARLQFEIQDTGPGMDAEQQASLFQPFKRLGRDDSRGGTGLGLYLCQTFVKSMKGKIEIKSELGKGSTFIVEIPFLRVEKLSVSRTAGEPLDFAGAKILVAEDEPANQVVMRLSLLDLGVIPTLVGDGREALKYLEQNIFDVVFLDCHMPLLNGYETVAEIRKRGWNLPVIACSASQMPEERKRCLESGMNDFLPKPYSIEDLTRVLKQWCPRSSKAFSAQEPIQTDLSLHKVFEESYAQGVLELELFQNQGNREREKFVAHRLKGGCLIMGEKHLADLLEQIEMEPGSKMAKRALQELKEVLRRREAS